MSYADTYSKNLFVYSYDELVTNPPVQIRKIIEWLDWDWSEEYFKKYSSF